jgi:hypothetical protein
MFGAPLLCVTSISSPVRVFVFGQPGSETPHLKVCGVYRPHTVAGQKVSTDPIRLSVLARICAVQSGWVLSDPFRPVVLLGAETFSKHFDRSRRPGSASEFRLL